MAKPVKPSLGCAYVVFLFLLLLGGGLLAGGWAEGGRGRSINPPAIILAVVGTVFVVGSFAYLRFAHREVARHEKAERISAENPDKPWLAKPQWQGPAIDARTGQHAAFLWFFAIVWNAISLAATVAVLAKQQEEKGAYIVLLFPLIGVFLLWAAIHQTIRLRKFGRVRFVPSGVPGVVGGYLGGVIEVPGRLVLESDVRVTLRCVREVTRGSGKNRSTTQTVLWEKEELVARDQWMGTTDRTDIPVLFYVPPECEPWNDDDPADAVVWRLRAEAAVPGVDFSTDFDVPVFRTGETAAPPEPGRPLLAEYRSGPPDAESLRRAGVRVLADGFAFDSDHLRTGRMISTAVTVTLGALGLFLLFAGAHFAVFMFVGFIWLIAALFAADLWTGRFEVRLVGPEVVVTQWRPWGLRVTKLARSDIARVKAESSMQAGETKYYRLALLGRDGVDPGQAASGEHFDARKLRFQLGRVARQAGVQEPAKVGAPGAAILDEMGRTPKFRVVVAKHIAGLATAESIADVMEKRIRGSIVTGD